MRSARCEISDPRCRRRGETLLGKQLLRFPMNLGKVSHLIVSKPSGRGHSPHLGYEYEFTCFNARKCFSKVGESRESGRVAEQEKQGSEETTHNFPNHRRVNLPRRFCSSVGNSLHLILFDALMTTMPRCAARSTCIEASCLRSGTPVRKHRRMAVSLRGARGATIHKNCRKFRTLLNGATFSE